MRCRINPNVHTSSIRLLSMMQQYCSVSEIMNKMKLEIKSAKVSDRSANVIFRRACTCRAAMDAAAIESIESCCCVSVGANQESGQKVERANTNENGVEVITSENGAQRHSTAAACDFGEMDVNVTFQNVNTSPSGIVGQGRN